MEGSEGKGRGGHRRNVVRVIVRRRMMQEKF